MICVALRRTEALELNSGSRILPTALPPGVLVKYMPDIHGQVWRVWILSKQEAAQPDPKK